LNAKEFKRLTRPPVCYFDKFRFLATAKRRCAANTTDPDEKLQTQSVGLFLSPAKAAGYFTRSEMQASLPSRGAFSTSQQLPSLATGKSELIKVVMF
jgi:hypothetical protein